MHTVLLFSSTMFQQWMIEIEDFFQKVLSVTGMEEWIEIVTGSEDQSPVYWFTGRSEV